jgi:hypothetical protein
MTPYLALLLITVVGPAYGFFVSGLEFRPQSPNATLVSAGSGSFPASGSETTEYWAPVHLSKSSRITSIEIDYCRFVSGPAGELNLVLANFNSDGRRQVLAEVGPETLGCTRITVEADPVITDPREVLTYLIATFGSNGGQVILNGARVAVTPVSKRRRPVR